MELSSVQPAQPQLGDVLANDSYLRERIAPRLTDPNYLSLVDLLQVVRAFAREAHGSVFDFGCGGAPYRELFTSADRYVGADLFAGPRVDKLLPSAGETEEAAAVYDAVLSTQVLEHVQKPDEYLQECYRILKPGGQILLTTHGLFQEHGCPWDFQRWTARGLKELFQRHSFEIVRSYKLTAGVRGAFQLSHQAMEQIRCQRPLLLFFCFAVYRKIYRRCVIPGANWIGRKFFAEDGVKAADDASPIYVGVGVWARKPF